CLPNPYSCSGRAMHFSCDTDPQDHPESSSRQVHPYCDPSQLCSRRYRTNYFHESRGETVQAAAGFQEKRFFRAVHRPCHSSDLPAVRFAESAYPPLAAPGWLQKNSERPEPPGELLETGLSSDCFSWHSFLVIEQ